MNVSDVKCYNFILKVASSYLKILVLTEGGASAPKASPLNPPLCVCNCLYVDAGLYCVLPMFMCI